MSLQKKSIQGVVWAAIQNWGKQLITTLVLLVLARLLKPEAFGLIALASVYLVFTQIFVEQGFAQAIVQRKDLDDRHLDSAFWASLASGLLFAGVTFFAADLVAWFFEVEELGSIVRWLSLSFLITPFSSVQQAIFQRRMAFKSLAARTLIAQATSGAIGVAMAFAGFGVWSLVGQRISQGVVSVIVLWRVSDWRPSFRFSMPHLRELFSFGINIIGLRLINFANTRSADLLIGKFMGHEVLGYYTVACRLMTLSEELMSSMLNQVALPAFSKLQGDLERMRRAIYSVSGVSTLLAPPFFLALCALAPDLTVLLFGAKWLPSVPVMQILTFIGIVHAVFNINGTVITSLGKPSWRLYLTLLNAVVNTAAFFFVVLVLDGGITAVALALVIRGYVLLPLPLMLLRRLTDLDLGIYLRQWIVPLVAAALMAGLLLWLERIIGGNLPLWGSVAVRVLAGIGFYGALVALAAPSRVQQVFSWARMAIPSRFVQARHKTTP